MDFIGRPEQLRLLPYEECRDQITAGMAFCFGGDAGGVVADGLAHMIQRATDSDYYHVAVAGWDYSTQVCLLGESTSPESRIVSVSSQVRRFPGGIDVYRLRTDLLREVDQLALWRFLERASGIDYPEAQLLKDWWHLTFGHGQNTPNCDVPDGQRRVCSQLAHAAFRIAGLPPINELDARVYPRDFADPTYWVYQFTPTM